MFPQKTKERGSDNKVGELNPARCKEKSSRQSKPKQKQRSGTSQGFPKLAPIVDCEDGLGDVVAATQGISLGGARGLLKMVPTATSEANGHRVQAKSQKQKSWADLAKTREDNGAGHQQQHKQQSPHLPQLEQSSSSSCVKPVTEGNRVNMTSDSREGFFLVPSSDMCTPGGIRSPSDDRVCIRVNLGKEPRKTPTLSRIGPRHAIMRWPRSSCNRRRRPSSSRSRYSISS